MIPRKIKEQALVNVLKQATLKQASPNLTEHIIAQIQQEQLELTPNDLLFEKTIKIAATPSAPPKLSINVISKLESQIKKPVEYRPLISKNLKYAYAVLMGLGVFYLLFFGTFSLGPLFTNFNDFSSKYTLLLTSCLCLIAFALLDVFLKKRDTFNLP